MERADRHWDVVQRIDPDVSLLERGYGGDDFERYVRPTAIAIQEPDNVSVTNQSWFRSHSSRSPTYMTSEVIAKPSVDALRAAACQFLRERQTLLKRQGEEASVVARAAVMTAATSNVPDIEGAKSCPLSFSLRESDLLSGILSAWRNLIVFASRCLSCVPRRFDHS